MSNKKIDVLEEIMNENVLVTHLLDILKNWLSFFPNYNNVSEKEIHITVHKACTENDQMLSVISIIKDKIKESDKQINALLEDLYNAEEMEENQHE